MDWLRLYSGVLNDPKVQRLPLSAFKGWINLLCLANESEPRGSLPGQEELAFALRLSDGEATELVDRLKSAGLLDECDGVLSPHNWDGRQYASDDVNARVARHREKKRSVAPGNAEVTPSNTVETLHVTLHVTPPDTDTDTEQKQSRTEEAQASPAAADAARPAKKGTKLNRRLEPEPDFEERMLALYGTRASPEEIRSWIALDYNYYRQEMAKGKYADIELCIRGSIEDRHLGQRSNGNGRSNGTSNRVQPAATHGFAGLE